MLLFSFVIALFPRRLRQPVHSGKRSLRTTDSSKNEEQQLTKAMLSDFMPADPVPKQKENPHAPDASATIVEGTVLTDSGI
jgi:hypothetical protein